MAVIACVLWVAGFEVLPWMHMATHGHAGRHHHDANGAIVRDLEVAEPAHDHDDHDAEIDEHATSGRHAHDDDDVDHDIDEHATDAASAGDQHDDGFDDLVDEHAAGHDALDHDEDAEVDEHGVLVHLHHSHERTKKPAADEEARLAENLAHGRDSLAHHDVAVHVPAPVITSPVPVDRRPTFVIETKAIEPFSFSPGRAVARGPPIVAFS